MMPSVSCPGRSSRPSVDLVPRSTARALAATELVNKVLLSNADSAMYAAKRQDGGFLMARNISPTSPDVPVRSAVVSWSEDNSLVYQQLAAVAVPDRAEQMATLLTLLPFGQADAARVLELGCGEGRLSQAVLDAYPEAHVVALDGSEEMRARARTRLDPHRATIEAFDLAAGDWWPHVENANAVVSSLAIHHLDGTHKQRLFSAVAQRLMHDGALLIADLVAPQRPEAHQVFATGWDRAAERQATQPEVYARFKDTQWNIFWYPDPVDMPSPLFEQLLWLQQAGFLGVDCFWQRAGHAVYGGYRSAERADADVLPFAEALRAAEAALAD